MIKLLDAPSWSSCGPNPIVVGNSSVVGAIQCVVGQRTSQAGEPDEFTLFAGTVNGGVWRTNGFTGAILQGGGPPPAIEWVPLTDAAPTLAIISLALDPLDPDGNTLWVGTGQVSSSGSGGPAVGLLKSINARDRSPTWTPPLGVRAQPADVSLDGQRIIRIVPTSLMDEGTGQQIILVAAFDGEGILRSKDGGTSFQRVNGPAGPLSGFATDLIADPNDPRTFYAAIRATYDGNNNLTTQGGIFRSTDGGLNWTEIDDGIPLASCSRSLKLAVFDNSGGTVPAAGPTILYAGQSQTEPSDPPNLIGIFRLAEPRDAQPQWTALFLDPHPDKTRKPNGFNPNDVHDEWPQPFEVPYFAMAVDPTDWNNLYLSGGFSTLDRVRVVTQANSAPSTNWTRWDQGVFSDHRSLTFLTGNILLCTCDQGIYGLNDPANSRQWVSLNNSIAITEFYAVAYDPTTGFICGGAQDVGSSVQKDGGGWEQLPNDGGDGSLVVVGSDGAIYYEASPGGHFGDFRIDMKGNAIKPVGIPKVWGPHGVAVNPANPMQLLAKVGTGPKMLVESKDRGESVSDITLPNIEGIITALAYGTDNPHAAYVGTSMGQLFMRTDDNGAFSLVANYPGKDDRGMPSPVNDIAVDRNDWRRVVIIRADGGLPYTTDAGESWNNIRGNAGDVLQFMRKIELVSEGADVVILIAGDPPRGSSGIVRTINPDTSQPKPPVIWCKFGTGLPNVNVFDLHFIPSVTLQDGSPGGNLLLAGTLGRGAWKIDEVTATGDATITGVVTDMNGTPIVDASVLVGSTQLATDSKGVYTLTVNPGVYEIIAVQSGFVPGHANVAACPWETITQPFMLQPAEAFTISGKVTDMRENPIPGATVRVIQIDAGVPGIITATTNSTGFYNITMDPGSYDGRYSVTAFASGFEGTSIVIDKIPNGAVITQPFVLGRIGILAGVVTDTNGMPLTGAGVLVGQGIPIVGQPNTFSFSSNTDSTGHYSIVIEPHGDYNAVAFQSGFEDSEPAALTIRLDETTPQNFVLSKAMPGSISGTVTDSDSGDPIGGATVEARGVDPPSESKTTATDDAGDYILPDVLAGTYQVTATAKRYHGDNQIVKVIAGQTVTANFDLNPIRPPPPV